MVNADAILYGDPERVSPALAERIGPMALMPSQVNGLLSAEEKQSLLKDAQRIYEIAEETEQASDRKSGEAAAWELRLLASELTELAVEDEPAEPVFGIIDTLREAASVFEGLATDAGLHDNLFAVALRLELDADDRSAP